MAVLYVVAAWLIMQVVGVLIDLGSVPERIGPIILPLLVIGFPIALIFSWFYELTSEGINLEQDVDAAESITHVTGRRIDFIVISLLCAAVILFAYDKWWIGPPPEKSIAVLAFENMSGDPDQEYFSDGITEELLNVLAGVPELTVISRSSAFSFKGKDLSIRKIAEQLNVAHVLEGSVRRDGNRIRITAQLIEASSDAHLWSQSYDRELGDIFAVQDEIAEAISDALKVELALVAGKAMLPASTSDANTDAYDAYLQGRELFRTREVEKAVLHLERSLRLDYNFAPAHAQLAIATTLLGHRGVYSLEEVMRIAVPHLDRAQKLDPDLAEVHAGRAILAGLAGDFETEVEHAQRALELNPSYGDAMNWLQVALFFLGRYEEHDLSMEKMLTADPLDFVVRFNYAEWLCQNGRNDEARKLADQVLVQDSQWGAWAHANLSIFYEGKLAEGLSYALQVPEHRWASWVLSRVGEYDEAGRIAPGMSPWFVDASQGDWDSAVRTVQDPPDHVDDLVIAGGTLVQAGRYREALPLLERAQAKAPEGRPIAHELGARATIWLAEARRYMGDEDGAQLAAGISRRDLAAQRAAGRDHVDLRLNEAILAAFDNDTDRVIASLEKAIERGLRDLAFHYSAASFAQFEDEPRFVALRDEVERLIAEEHDNVLQLICFNNPVPDDWQPLPETCDGVVEQGKSGV